MKSLFRLIAVLVLALPFLWGGAVSGQPEDSGDKTLSPYFFVRSDDPDLDALPLKSTAAAVRISGVIADVHVTQVYRNEGKRPIEAVYVFPASTRAAVYGMKMTVGKRVIEAKIRKRDEARQEYEKAREQGKSASLLEQQRPNVFSMNVANILPGDEIRVELRYTELMVPADRVYEFVYPTVVGPRYSNTPAEAAPASERWVQNPYHRQGEAPAYTFDITATLEAGMPIRELACTTHKVNTAYSGPSSATVKLDGSESSGGNRDFVLRYRLAGDRVQSGLLLYEGPKEKFFLLLMEPPKRVTAENIPGREYIFIVDVSGSMHGFPLEISKKLLRDLIGGLRPTDRFNVLLFSGGSTLMAEASLPATADNIQRALSVIDRQRGGGGTELLPAMNRALKLPKPDSYARTLVIVTDGYVHVEEETFDLIRSHLGDASLFAFGIGSSVNRHIIEGMARVGMGEPFVITKPGEAPAQAERFRRMIASPVLTGIQLDFGGFGAYDVEPRSIPDVLAERPVIVFGKWRGEARGRLTLRGTSGSGPWSEVIDAAKVQPSKANASLRYLWARHRVALLSDYNRLRPDDGRVREVTDLGLRYNLLTAYTSFVAVDTEVRNTGEKAVTVRQPLPLPQGVSDYAVGGLAASKVFAARETLQAAPAATEGKAHREKDAATGAKGAVTVEKVAVTQGLPQDSIRSTAEKRIGEIEACLTGAGQKGGVTLELTLRKDGTVKGVKIVKTTLQGKTTGACIAGIVKTWQFPPLQSGIEGKATITLSITS